MTDPTNPEFEKDEKGRVWWRPHVSEPWKRYGSTEWVLAEDDGRVWDEDIWSAAIGDIKEKNSLSIWLDGGKGLSIWQCTLAKANFDIETGEFFGHTNFMRDWFETIEEVQAWMIKACEIGRMLYTGEDKYKRDEHVE